MQRQQSLVHIPVPIGGHVEHVDGLVETGGGVHVGAEAGANRLEKRDQLTGLEVLRAVERHVLDEVREAALVGFLLKGAGVHGQTQ